MSTLLCYETREVLPCTAVRCCENSEVSWPIMYREREKAGNANGILVAKLLRIDRSEE